MPYKFTLILLVFNSLFLFAQPRLEMYPDNVEFEDVFHRNKNVFFINTGDAPLRIDSLVYKRSNYYFLRFNRPWNYPVFLQPNDTVKMDCILESYVYVPSADTSDTLFIYNNGVKPLEKLKVKIKYYDDDYHKGYIDGQITDGVNPVSNASVYFFYDNNYIISSVKTNQSGFYYAQLPPGQYAIAVEKDSFYVSFFENQYDPFNADLILLQSDSTKTINLQIDRMQITGNSVSGNITDSLTFAKIKKGILIVRTGTHTPGKILSGVNNRILQNEIYTAFVKPDGSYKVENIITQGYYFVQAFSDYFMPSFYNFVNKPAVFWQQADSLYVSGSLSNVNVVMQRDSSVGGGKINGNVTVNSEAVSLSDVMILAKSTDHNLWYNFGFLKDSNEFKISNLPYGNYKLFAQKIGFNNGVSTDLQISSSTTVINGVSIPIFLSSVKGGNLLPDEIQLYQNYPNPFNPTTLIKFELKEREIVRVSVLNILGEEIRVLLSEEKGAGYHTIDFDGSDLTSGVYFYRIQVGNFIRTNKMILLK